MLDQADFVKRYDKEDMLGAAGRMTQQLDWTVPEQAGLKKLARPEAIVVAAMGDSALAGEFVRSWLADRLSVPVVVTHDYTLPEFVGPKTLVVVASYSGSTEETLSVLTDARARKAVVVTMAAGGKLLEVARAGSETCVELPGDFPPRLSLMYPLVALTAVLEALGLVQGAMDELRSARKWLDGQAAAWGVNSPQAENEAKQIASELAGQSMVVYGGTAMGFAALKWKIALNQNAKNLAFWNGLPEMNHNELSSWSFPREHGFKVVELRSSLDHPRVVKRFEVMNRLLSNRWAPIEVVAAGETKLRALLWCLVLGDFVSIYLGVLNQVDVASLPLVDKFKRELNS